VAAVTVDRRGAVTFLTLNRPERRNALDAGLRAELEAAVAEFESDAAQRVAVLAGAGPAFCAGADLREVATRVEDGSVITVGSTSLFGIGESPKPWLAAVDGPAVAGGLELALNCDIRVASRSAWFALTETSLGLVPGVAVHQLVRQLAWGDAMLLLLGERLDATEALRIGLVQRVVDTDAVAHAASIAERIASFPPGTVRACKAVARHWRDHGLEEAIAFYREVTTAMSDGASVRGRLEALLLPRHGK
jgi:enoyl-CoA hydratase/carnithine racemase